MSLSERIVYIQQQEGFTASHFAEIIGIQRSGLSHIYSGRNKPSIDFLQKLIQKFPHYNTDWILTGEGKPLKTQQNSKNNQKTSESAPKPEAGNLFAALKDEDPAPYHTSGQKSGDGKNPVQQDFSNQGVFSEKIKQIILIFDDNTFEIIRAKNQK